jgi:shikimate kinase
MSRPNIYLIGMPSSGKSTLGKPLAKALRYQFVDMDEWIESQEGLWISEIFQLKGEAFFREKERETLRKFPLNQGFVIATGGGTPCFFDNMDYIKATGKSIFLDVSPEQLWTRMLKSESNHRPLFDTKNMEQLRIDLQTRYRQRLPFYQRADLCVEGNIEVEHLLMLLSL